MWNCGTDPDTESVFTGRDQGLERWRT